MYSFAGWTTDPNKRMILAYSSVPSIQLRLPSANTNASSSFHVSAQIRDTLSCVTEYNVSTVTVYPDTDQIIDFVDAVQQSTGTSGLTNNPTIQILASGNLNAVGQVVSSLSQQLNQITTQSLQDAMASEFLPSTGRIQMKTKEIYCLDGMPASSVAVSTLDATTQSTVSTLSFSRKMINLRL